MVDADRESNFAESNEMRRGFIQKHCPKCGGNIFLDVDAYGWYEECLQCGYRCSLKSIVEVREKASKGNPKHTKGSTQVT